MAKIGKKDVTESKKQMIDLELNSGEIEALRCVLNSLTKVAGHNYEDIEYRYVDQFFSLSDLHQLLKDNWKLASSEPAIYKVLLAITKSANAVLADFILGLIKDFEDNEVTINRLLITKTIADLMNKISGLSPEETELVLSSISYESKTILDQHLRIEELKEFINNIKQSIELEQNEEILQQLFTKNNWIISQIYTYPFIFHKDKVHVGGQTLEKDGGVADYITKNSITSNVSLIEIKKSSDTLVNDKPYREGLNTYSMSDDLIGGVVQVLDYKNSLITNSCHLLSPKDLNSFNPQCVLLIGRLKGLNNDQIRSFELYRSELKNVTVITYDELVERLELILLCLEKRD